MTVRLNPFQFVGAHKLYTEERFLLADDMGMYKTSQAIFANNKFREKKKGKLRTLVVCPTSVRDHWAREINRWGYPHNQDITILNSPTLVNDIHSAKKSEWTIMHYPLASRMDDDITQKLINTGFHHVILDEVHNAKNPYSIRTKVIKGIADQADYLSLLSGTPIPNTVSDLYTLMSLLDPEKYPLSADDLETAKKRFIYLYLDQPQAVKELFHQKMLARKAEDYLSEELPELQVHRMSILLKGLHLDEYCRLLAQDLPAGRKIVELQKVSIDPMLQNWDLPRRQRGKDVSQKYEFLDEIVDKEMRTKKGKVVIFTHLKEGIVDPLVRRYEKYGAISITGDVDASIGGEREGLRQQFQNDPKTRILIATTTMNEGVDLTAATSVVNLTIPWMPAEYYQRYKRSHRHGEVQKEKVDVYVPYVTIPGEQLSLEEACLQMLDGKEKVIRYMMSGIQVSKEELSELNEPGKVPRIRHAIKSPNKAILDYYVDFRGLGSERARKRIEKDPTINQFICSLYPYFGMAENAASIYVPIIKEELEEKKKLHPKVDLACGPGMLGYYLQESTIGIDINSEMLRVGKEFYPPNKLILGAMHDIPLESRVAELVVCSLAFQMTEPKTERAQTLQEMNRILKPKGYAIIVLPPNYLENGDYRRFEHAVDAYGFTIKDHQLNQSSSGLEVYVFQKNRAAQRDIYNLTLKGDGKKKK